MRNIVPARALARRSRNFLFAAVLVFFLGILALAFSFFMRGIPLVVPANPNYDFYVLTQDLLLWLGVGLIVIALFIALRATTWKQDNPLALMIGEELAKVLDDRYVYIRNVNKFALGYMDAVLVGPAGALVFRITNKAGVFFNEGAYWMRQKDKGEWQTLKWSPTKECVADIKKLREFLQSRGLADAPVFGVVVFTEQEPATIVTTDKPVIPVLQPHELSYGLEDSYFSKKDRLDQLAANRIATLILG